MTTVGSHTLNPFPSPVRGPAVDANLVRGNDNQLQAKLNAHDLDPTIHVQSSTLANRPAAGVAGRTWVTNNAGVYEHWYDDGSNWQRIYGLQYEEGTWTPFLSSAGATFTYSTQAGTYRRIGDFVFMSGRIVVSGLSGTTSNSCIIGIPFVTPSVANYRASGSFAALNNLASDLPYLKLQAASGWSYFQLVKNATNAGFTQSIASDIGGSAVLNFTLSFYI